MIYVSKKGTAHVGGVCNFSIFLPHFWRATNQTLILISCTALPRMILRTLRSGSSGHRVIPSWSPCKKGHVDGPCCGAWSWSPSHGWFYTKDSSYNCGFFCFVGTLVPQFHTLKGESLGTPFVWWKTQSFPAPKAWPSHLRCPEPARGAEVRKGGAHFWRCHGQKVFVNIC